MCRLTERGREIRKEREKMNIMVMINVGGVNFGIDKTICQQKRKERERGMGEQREGKNTAVSKASRAY